MLGAIQVLPISVLQVGEGPIVSNSEYRHPKWQMSKHIDNQWEGIYKRKRRNVNHAQIKICILLTQAHSSDLLQNQKKKPSQLRQ
jgi:hypothetical protein